MSWQHVRGHEAAIEGFDQVWKRGRLAHAYLLLGPEGVGKRRFAGELAKALLCEAAERARLEACDRCAACLLFDAGTHPDYFEAARPADSLEVPIETIRTLCGCFALKPARGHGKVAVLDDADDLNDAAGNCFLKTLEEPPPRALLLLVGTRIDRQLPTLVSRCQVVRFAPLPEALVAELLHEQGIEDAARARRLARLSEGSLGRAQELADPALWEFRRQLVRGLLQPRPDTPALARRWAEFVEEAGKESAVQRLRAALVLRLLIDFLSDALALSVGKTPRLDDPEDVKILKELADRADADRLIELIDRCLESDFQIDRRVQLVLIVEALVDALGQMQTR